MEEINPNVIELFLNKMKDDNDFAQKIANINEPEEIQTVAKNNGIDLTMNDIMASKEIFLKAIDSANKEELSEEDLDNIAGGLAVTITVALIGLAGVIIGGLLDNEHVKKWKW